MAEDVVDGLPGFRATPKCTPQEDLIERATHVLSNDDRVLGVWLAGSFATGTHDRFSDVDLWVVVNQDDVAGFCTDWPTISDEIAPTVLRQQVGDRPIFNQVTASWLRFDVSIGTPANVSDRTTSTVKPLYDPQGLSAGLGQPGRPFIPTPNASKPLVGNSFGCWVCCQLSSVAVNTSWACRAPHCCGRCSSS